MRSGREAANKNRQQDGQKNDEECCEQYEH